MSNTMILSREEVSHLDSISPPCSLLSLSQTGTSSRLSLKLSALLVKSAAKIRGGSRIHHLQSREMCGSRRESPVGFYEPICPGAETWHTRCISAHQMMLSTISVCAGESYLHASLNARAPVIEICMCVVLLHNFYFVPAITFKWVAQRFIFSAYRYRRKSFNCDESWPWY